jgi:hypothetical protein
MHSSIAWGVLGSSAVFKVHGGDQTGVSRRRL